LPRSGGNPPPRDGWSMTTESAVRRRRRGSWPRACPISLYRVCSSRTEAPRGASYLNGGELGGQDALAFRTDDHAAAARQRRREGGDGPLQTEHAQGPDRLATMRTAGRQFQGVRRSPVPFRRNLDRVDWQLVNFVAVRHRRRRRL